MGRNSRPKSPGVGSPHALSSAGREPRRRIRSASPARSRGETVRAGQGCRRAASRDGDGSRGEPRSSRSGADAEPSRRPGEGAGEARAGKRRASRSASAQGNSLEPPGRKRRRAHSGDRGSDRPHALFLMGLPGAGKTTVKRRRMHRNDLDIEPDRFKRRHPRFSIDMGEETDEEVHRWSVRRAADAYDDALATPRKQNLVFDSSGSNARWLGRRIIMAREAGFKTELLWVDVPVEIALFRNRNRAEHGQWCPERVIMDKAKVMENSFEELRKEADSVERLQNWSERSDELEKANWDLHVYPAPRTRPCTLRPGHTGYGEAPPSAKSPSPSRGSRRTIRIGPWKRNDEVAKRKNARLAWMDRTYRGNRERYVSDEVLGRRDILVEENKFPYHLPPDIQHWTIWNRRDMNHGELCEYIEAWLDARRPHNVIAWNYDDNRGRRTIDIWHVHIYFQGADGQPPEFRTRTTNEASLGADASAAARRVSLHRSPCSV